MESQRLPRFHRSEAIPAMLLTERDRQLVWHVHRHRFLRSTQLVALTGDQAQPVLRRLQRLYHHGYLDRPRAQLDYFHEGGSRPLVYGLGSRGASLLRREFDIPFSQMDWSGKRGSVGRLFLEHALLTSEVMVTAELACRARSGLQLRMNDELKLPDSPTRRIDPFRWRVRLPGERDVGLIPDRVFAFESGNPSDTSSAQHFFLEADRGTMPVTRSGIGQTSFYRKLLSYEATWSQNLHRSRFGWKRFRVLTVTTSKERVESMLSACRQLARGHGLFLFTDIATLRTHEDFLTLPWRTCRGEASVRLLD